MRRYQVNGRWLTEAQVLAHAQRLHRRATQYSDGYWRVEAESQPGTEYTVMVAYGQALCTCPAGKAGRPCKHAAAALLLTVR